MFRKAEPAPLRALPKVLSLIGVVLFLIGVYGFWSGLVRPPGFARDAVRPLGRPVRARVR